MRPIPQAAIALAKSKETLVLFAYDDAHFPPREARPGDTIDGTLTAGYGHTGEDVSIGMIVTETMADQWLLADFTRAAYQLRAVLPDDVIADLTENQYATMLDFVLNLGTGDPKKREWTIWQTLRARNFDQVPAKLSEFVNAERRQPDGTFKKVKLQGLVDRRNAEIALWSTAEPGSVAENLPSSVTRRIATPPTSTDPTPITKKNSIRAAVVAAATAAAPMAETIGNTTSEVSKKIAPFADHSVYVQHALGVLATVSAVCVAVAMVLMVREHRNAQH